jgi:hypothetical protein
MSNLSTSAHDLLSSQILFLIPSSGSLRLVTRFRAQCSIHVFTSARLAKRPSYPYAPPDVGETRDMYVSEKCVGYTRRISVNDDDVAADVTMDPSVSRALFVASLLSACCPRASGSSTDN